MRTAGAIYRKLKEVRFRHWVVFYHKLVKKYPENCKYNYGYRFRGNDGKIYEIKLCMLHQENINLDKGIQPHLLDVCQAEEDCKNCNAFLNRYSKEEIKELFVSELNTKKVKETEYPDICALEWVLEKYVEGYPPISTIQELYFKIKNLILKTKKRG
jgi:hypothetical protein